MSWVRSVLGPKCLGSEVSWVRSVCTPAYHQKSEKCVHCINQCGNYLYRIFLKLITKHYPLSQIYNTLLSLPWKTVTITRASVCLFFQDPRTHLELNHAHDPVNIRDGSISLLRFRYSINTILSIRYLENIAISISISKFSK